jgi:hypothetical protein
MCECQRNILCNAVLSSDSLAGLQSAASLIEGSGCGLISAAVLSLESAMLLMEAALRWLADHTPASAEMLRHPPPCGQSLTTARRPSAMTKDLGEPSGGHLRLACVVHAHEQDGGLACHTWPFCSVPDGRSSGLAYGPDRL